MKARIIERDGKFYPLVKHGDTWRHLLPDFRTRETIWSGVGHDSLQSAKKLIDEYKGYEV